MAENSRTIFYKNFQIDIEPTRLSPKGWQPTWWIWISDEATRFFDAIEFETEDLANLYAEKSAKRYIDKELLGLQ
ncbi:MAG: hypothetical protein ACYCZ7_00905 [Minisyncoccota bacterium]